MDFVDTFNAWEAAWWALMAAVCFGTGRGPYRRMARTAAVLFALFTITDLIELQTGAWWRPWWLAAANGACVIGLVSCGAWAWRIRSRAT